MKDLIIYNTPDGRASVALYAKDGNVWLNQSQIAELFATSKPNISLHVNNIFKDNELDRNSVVKYFLTTAADGKEYNVEYKWSSRLDGDHEICQFTINYGQNVGNYYIKPELRL